MLLPGGRYDPRAMLEEFQRGELTMCGDILRRGVSRARETLGSTGDPQLADFILDRAYFEELTALSGRLQRVIVSGDRAADMRIRIKYAGIDDAAIETQTDYAKLVEWIAGQELPVYIMPTYTAMLELREAVIRHCGGSEFWE